MIPGEKTSMTVQVGAKRVRCSVYRQGSTYTIVPDSNPDIQESGFNVVRVAEAVARRLQAGARAGPGR